MSYVIDPERVVVTIADHVAEVCLVRVDKHNGLDLAMFHSIVAAAEQIAADKSVRAVVLHGAGPSFCSGLDIMSIRGDFTALVGQEGTTNPNLAQRVTTDWISLPVPVIAAIHGSCFGGGLQIALGADIRCVAPDARLSVMESKWGLIPDMGVTQVLPRIMSLDKALELTYTGRIISGTDAVSWGLASHVTTNPLAHAQALAREIAGKSPDAVRAAKALYRETWMANEAVPALARETELQMKLIGSPNQVAAATSVFTKEPPQYGEPII